MRRRDVLKGVALAAASTFISFRAARGEAKTVQTLTSERYSGKTRRMEVELHVYPDKDGKLEDRFQELVEGWERRNASFRPVEAVSFEPQMEDGGPWLVHPAWKPVSKDNLSTLFTESRNVFRDRRWRIIERAINLRETGYWRQEYGPQWEAYQAHPNGLDGGGCSPAYSHMKRFRRVARKRLYKVVVRFEAIPLSELNRFSGGSYEHLENEATLLKISRVRLSRDGLTPRLYFQALNKRYDKLGLIEAAAYRG